MQYTEKLITKDTENLITNEGLFDDQLFRQSAEIVVSKLEKYLADFLAESMLAEALAAGVDNGSLFTDQLGAVGNDENFMTED